MGDTFKTSTYADPFVKHLVDFVAGDTFQTLFENFFITHALEFDNEEEHKLHYYTLYQKFSAMFEDQLDQFCKQENLSYPDFARKCREASETDAKVQHYVDILLGSTEYNTFVKLMRLMRPVAEKRLGVKADAKGTSSGANTETGEKASDAKASEAAKASSKEEGSKEEGEEKAAAAPAATDASSKEEGEEKAAAAPAAPAATDDKSPGAAVETTDSKEVSSETPVAADRKVERGDETAGEKDGISEKESAK
jgi:hypothetical protein